MAGPRCSDESPAARRIDPCSFPRLRSLLILSALGVTSLLVARDDVLSAATSRASRGSRRGAVVVGPATIRGVYYINLDESSERREHFLRSYSSLPIPGVEHEPVRIPAVSLNRAGYGLNSVGCGLSHIRALEAVVDRPESDGERGGACWYLVCEDDAAGNFTALPSLLESTLSGRNFFRPHINAINLNSPRHILRRMGFGGGSSLSTNDEEGYSDESELFSSSLPGFGSRTTAYLVTPSGARWMLRTLLRWNATVAERLERHPNATVRDKTGGRLRRGGSIIPPDMMLSWSWGGWVHAVSYRGVGSGSIKPRGIFPSTIKVKVE